MFIINVLVHVHSSKVKTSFSHWCKENNRSISVFQAVLLECICQTLSSFVVVFKFLCILKSNSVFLSGRDDRIPLNGNRGDPDTSCNVKSPLEMKVL
jgi:hypothetical protein